MNSNLLDQMKEDKQTKIVINAKDIKFLEIQMKMDYTQAYLKLKAKKGNLE